MGLDNGIQLKTTDSIYPKWATVSPYNKSSAEVCYWRKCWGIREAILKVLDPEGFKHDDCEFPVEAEDIPAIIRALKPFFSKEYWDENARSIWEFEDMFESLVHQVCNLEKLKEFLEDNPGSTAYFYDSY